MFLTTSQTAEKLGISVERVKKLAQTGTLPHLPLNNPESPRKFYKFDEKAVVAYKHSLRQVAAMKQDVKTDMNVPTMAMPEGWLSLADAAAKIGIKRQALYDRIKYHPNDWKVQKVGRVMFVAPESIDAEIQRRRAAKAGAVAVLAQPDESINLRYADDGTPVVMNPSPAAQSSSMPAAILAAVSRLERRQNAIVEHMNIMTAKIDQLLKVWS